MCAQLFLKKIISKKINRFLFDALKVLILLVFQRFRFFSLHIAAFSFHGSAWIKWSNKNKLHLIYRIKKKLSRFPVFFQIRR